MITQAQTKEVNAQTPETVDAATEAAENSNQPEVQEVKQPAGRPVSEANLKVQEAIQAQIKESGSFTVAQIEERVPDAGVAMIRRVYKKMIADAEIKADQFQKAQGSGRPVTEKHTAIRSQILNTIKDKGSVNIPELVETNTVGASEAFCRRILGSMLESGEVSNSQYQRVTGGGRKESELTGKLRAKATKTLEKSGQLTIKDLLKVADASNQQCLVVLKRLESEGVIKESGDYLENKGKAGRPARIYVAATA